MHAASDKNNKEKKDQLTEQKLIIHTENISQSIKLLWIFLFLHRK